MAFRYDEIINYIENHKDSLDVSKVVDMVYENETLNTMEKIVIYRSLPEDKVVAFLLTKPQHFEGLVRTLQPEEFRKVLSEIDDDSYKAKILMFSGIRGVAKYFYYLDDDYYIKLVSKNIYNVMDDRETIEKIIDSYRDWKALLIESTKSEREKTSTIAAVSDNDMKQAMLFLIKDKDNRNRIIQSMTSTIDPEIEEDVLLAQRMIESFFESKGNLTEEQKEKMKIILQTTNVKFAEVIDTEEKETSTVGLTDKNEKQIIIRKDFKEEPLSVLRILIHEYAHMFSNANFLLGENITNRPIEEGVADIFSDIVIQDFFEKNEEVELKNGEKLSLNSKDSFSNGYILYNAWTRSMLYPFQKDNKDIEFITQYLLGDKKVCWEMLHLDDYRNDKAIRVTPDFSLAYDAGYIKLAELYAGNKEAFQKIDNTSIYAKNNFIFSIFELQNQLEKQGYDVVKMFDHEEPLEATLAAQTYFQDKKIYEISGEEYKKLVALSEIPQYRDGKGFVTNFDPYIDMKFNELTEEEVKAHSAEILKSGIVLIRASENLSPVVSDIFQKAMENELEKSKKIERLEDFHKYVDLHTQVFHEYYGTFPKQKSPEGEKLSDMLNDFSDKLTNNLRTNLDAYKEKQDKVFSFIMNKKSLGQKLFDTAKKAKVRIGEVLAKTFAFQKDRKLEREEKERK